MMLEANIAAQQAAAAAEDQAKHDSAPPVVQQGKIKDSHVVDFESEDCEGPPPRSVSPISRASGHPQSDDGSTNQHNKDSDSEESQSSQFHGQGYRRAPKTVEMPAANQWPSHKRHGLTVKAGPSKDSSIAAK